MSSLIKVQGHTSIVTLYRRKCLLFGYDRYRGATNDRSAAKQTGIGNCSLWQYKVYLNCTKIPSRQHAESGNCDYTTIFANADGPRDAASRPIDHIALHTKLNPNAECYYQASSVGGYWKHIAAQTNSWQLLAHVCTVRLAQTPLVRFVVGMLYKQVHNKICCEHVCTTCRQQIEQVEFGRASLCTHVLTTVSCRSVQQLSLIHIWRCRRSYACRSRWSPYH